MSPSESPSADREPPASSLPASPAHASPSAYPVNTFNEWDPLEEIIVGVVEDALIPPWETITPAVVHDSAQWDFFKAEGGRRWPVEMLKKAEADIEAFVHIREAEGVTVRRPERFAWDQPIAAPGWSLPSSCLPSHLIGLKSA
jgi:glycine amidinotransferase